MQYHYRFQLISTCSSISAYYSTPLIDDETRCLPASKKLLICIYSHSYHPGKDCETPNHRPVVAFSRARAWSFTQCAHKNRAVTWRANRAASQPGGCQCVRVCKTQHTFSRSRQMDEYTSRFRKPDLSPTHTQCRSPLNFSLPKRCPWQRKVLIESDRSHHATTRQAGNQVGNALAGVYVRTGHATTAMV